MRRARWIPPVDGAGRGRRGRLRMGLAAACVFTSLWVQPAQARIHARIRRVGLFEGATPTVRSGNWSFVQVELRNSGSNVLEGELRVSQQDRDGDLVVSVQEVVVEPDGQWRPDEVYFTPNLPRGSDHLVVKLFDAEGRQVPLLSDTGEEVAELVSPIYNDRPPAEQFLILDLSVPRKLPHVAWLDSTRQRKADGHANVRVVRPLSPRELPERWQGLESVDAIVWDDADPSGLARQQIDALIDWVRHGGRLLLSSGTNWQSLVGSPLAAALPVTIHGVDPVREAQEFTEDIVKWDAYAARLESRYHRVPINRCEMSPRRGAIGIPSRCDNPQIAYRRLLGRGMLTFVGASLRQLLPAPKELAKIGGDDAPYTFDEDNPPDFIQVCEKVIASNFLALPRLRAQAGGYRLIRDPTDLFDQQVRLTIGFQGLGAAFLIFAILFALAYTAVATAGTYVYLKRRGWEHVCWSAFALVSIVGTVIGTGMVWTLRGFTTRLRQTTIIDARAGEDYGYGTCLLGVRTPNHTRLDLRLPAGDPDEARPRRLGLLRAMPASPSQWSGDSRFVAPGKYVSARAGSILEGVPVRATLKEFQGIWDGPLSGTLDARLIVPRGEWEFGEGSYIRNNLGLSLRDCCVLEGNQEIAGEAGRVTTRCLSLGTLPSGPGGELDAEALRRRLYFEAVSSGAAPPKRIPKPKLQLSEVMKRWRRTLGDRPDLTAVGPGAANVARLLPDQEVDALLLLSVFNLLESRQNGQVFHRSHGRTLDCTHRITRETAVLIGFSDERPPAVLDVDGDRLLPKKSLTMYRFVIPVIRK